jgi:hypothetical protein
MHVYVIVIKSNLGMLLFQNVMTFSISGIIGWDKADIYQSVVGHSRTA